MNAFSLFLFSGSILLGACDSHPPKAQLSDSARLEKSARTSTGAEKPATNRFKPADYQVYARRRTGIYSIILWKHRETTLSDPPDPFLVLKNSRSPTADTLAMNAIETLGESEDFDISDVSQQLGGDKPSFLVNWQGESDNIYTELIGYKGNYLKELANLPITGGLHNLKRVDEHTLEGAYSDRDELGGWSHDGYRLKISIPDYNTTIIPPDTILLDVDSEAKDTICASRILRGNSKEVPYNILPGTRLHIDTFFRKQHLVRLHLSDSIILRAVQQDIEFRIKGDDAG